MITTKKIEGTYIVSDRNTWLPGRYETDADARLAATLEPERLQSLWQSSLAAGKEGLIKHSALVTA